jgi:DNA-binding transcriptional MerR regulator
MPKSAAAPELLKISALARRSGVPAATIKHYLREGLLPGQHVKTSRNVAFYDATLVDRVKAIKELQRTRFLPLRVIKGVLDGVPSDADATTASAIASVLDELASRSARTREQLLAAGMPAAQLDYFCAIGIVTPDRTGGGERYVGDDLAMLQTLGEARRAGLTEEMLPIEILEPYLRAVREIVRTELRIFREGVVPRAGDRLGALVESGAKLSERLIVLLRRKMLLPTLRQMIAEAEAPRGKRSRGVEQDSPIDHVDHVEPAPASSPRPVAAAKPKRAKKTPAPAGAVPRLQPNAKPKKKVRS